ncbi:helix-turn-helix transcriptional regulator [Pedobacter sp. CFBP9032]|uniref:helix-turn-helix domain-containing protein n=1 Tax=Pedobacter sp. CFBP9032 TaxID=3096539 RepID=UPI002A6B5233|nr:helix-turn-helix transcriptional regulator [Pedobacter sp. CFBP9032]MDY0904296.1 helix-turn-helix transcriptional regulator [Pedobacter sp. CFBP9032]
MSTIENAMMLEGIITSEKILKLEAAAARHKEQSNISFTVTDVKNHTIEILTVQKETPSGKYANEATLVKKTEDLFRKISPEFKIIVSAETNFPSPAKLVNVPWIEKKMLEKGVRIKQIAFDSGIDRESISDWVTGKRSMSQIVKAMFYFYLSK